MSVQNLPSWEVVSGLLCWPDSSVSLTTAVLPTGQLGMQLDDWVKGYSGIEDSPEVHVTHGSAFKQLSNILGNKYMSGNLLKVEIQWMM